MARKRFITSGTPRLAKQSYDFKPLAKRAPSLNPSGWKNRQVTITNLINKDSQESRESNEKVATASSQSVDRT